MQRIAVPGTDLRVAEICLGLGGFGTRAVGDPADRLFDAYLAAGGNFVDTAHVYAAWVPDGAGRSERELGRLLRRVDRETIVVATKGGHPEFAGYPRPDAFLAPERLAEDVAESLDRLGTDHVDLYYVHRDDARVPAGEIVDALQALADAGSIRHYGASNWSVLRLAEAAEHATSNGRAGFRVVQNQWSLAVPNWPDRPDPTTRCVTPTEAYWLNFAKLPIAAYSAAANGYFAGAKVAQFDTPDNAARRARATWLAGELGCTPTQLALAWLRHQEPTAIPITGTCDAAHLHEALGCTTVSLSAEQARWLAEG